MDPYLSSSLFITFLICFCSVSAKKCFVCLPTVSGTLTSMKLANEYTAEISRTFPFMSQYDFGLCEKMADEPKFQADCPTSDRHTVCKTVKFQNWFARSCDRVAPDEPFGCKNDTFGVETCKCTNNFCNSATSFSISLIALVTPAVVAILMTI